MPLYSLQVVGSCVRDYTPVDWPVFLSGGARNYTCTASRYARCTFTVNPHILCEANARLLVYDKSMHDGFYVSVSPGVFERDLAYPIGSNIANVYCTATYRLVIMSETTIEAYNDNNHFRGLSGVIGSSPLLFEMSTDDIQDAVNTYTSLISMLDAITEAETTDLASLRFKTLENLFITKAKIAIPDIYYRPNMPGYVAAAHDFAASQKTSDLV